MNIRFDVRPWNLYVLLLPKVIAVAKSQPLVLNIIMISYCWKTFNVPSLFIKYAGRWECLDALRFIVRRISSVLRFSSFSFTHDLWERTLFRDTLQKAMKRKIWAMKYTPKKRERIVKQEPKWDESLCVETNFHSWTKYINVENSTEIFGFDNISMKFLCYGL